MHFVRKIILNFIIWSFFVTKMFKINNTTAANLYGMTQRLATRINLTHGFDTQEGQRSKWCKYAENAYKYNRFFSLS